MSIVSRMQALQREMNEAARQALEAAKNPKPRRKKRPVRLNPHEYNVLLFLVNEPVGEERFYGFAPIMADLGLDRKAVRRACRSLARKGFTSYCRGLWNDDGEPGGAGYAATDKGVEHIYKKIEDVQR